MQFSSIDHPLRDVATRVLSASTPAHPALKARAAIAQIGRVPITRPRQAPNYASDLGLRRSDDAAVFLEHSAAALCIDVNAAISRVRRHHVLRPWHCGDVSDAAAAGLLDVLISFGGAWSEAVELAIDLAEGRRQPRSTLLLTYIGAALTQGGDPRAGDYFVRAAAAEDALPAHYGMSRIRQAAWLAQRQGRPGDAVDVLRALRVWCDSAVTSRVLSPADGAAISGVALDLEAFTAVLRNDLDDADRLLVDAAEVLAHEPLVMVGDDERRRYTAQVQINRGQLAARRGAFDDALDIVRKNLEWTRVNHEDSVTEAAALTGYLLYRLARYDEAVATLRGVVPAIASEGSPSRLLLARKNLAAALSLSDRTACADEVLLDIATDPAGVEASRAAAGHEV